MAVLDLLWQSRTEPIYLQGMVEQPTKQLHGDEKNPSLRGNTMLKIKKSVPKLK